MTNSTQRKRKGGKESERTGKEQEKLDNNRD